MDIRNFNNVSLTFNRGNQDAKEKLIEIMKITGRTKVDIICDALRDYDPYKNFNKHQQNNNTGVNFNIDDIKTIVEQSVAKILSEKNINKECVNKTQNLSDKKIDKRFIEED